MSHFGRRLRERYGLMATRRFVDWVVRQLEEETDVVSSISPDFSGGFNANVHLPPLRVSYDPPSRILKTCLPQHLVLEGPGRWRAEDAGQAWDELYGFHMKSTEDLAYEIGIELGSHSLHTEEDRSVREAIFEYFLAHPDKVRPTYYALGLNLEGVCQAENGCQNVKAG